ncbi:MAG: hypothetical protein F6K30_02465 [Cyanothece sp. SIO2G6]|nr:hypothetical protein [Cyanothece sp. SIO2G6]
MNWITIKHTDNHWEAELMQQLLLAHGIQARIVGQGIGSAYLGSGSSCVLQVSPRDRWTALLLLSPVDDTCVDDTDDSWENPASDKTL